MRNSVAMTGIILLCLFISTYAQAIEEYSFQWRQIGDGKFDVWKLDEVFFVENVEMKNWKKTSKVSGEMLEDFSWRMIKESLGLKKCDVLKWEKGNLISDIEFIGQVHYLDMPYGEGKQLHLKAFWNNGNVQLKNEENIYSPFLIPSGDHTSYIFEDQGDLWKLTPPIFKGEYEVKKLSNDTINGLTRDQISKKIPENHYLLWCGEPTINTDGSYIAYISRKDSMSRGILNNLEIWLIDTEKETEKILCSGGEVRVFGWISRDIVVYSINGINYVHDLRIDKVVTLPNQSSIMQVGDNYILYTVKSDLRQIYLFDYIAQEYIVFPRLPADLILASYDFHTTWNYSLNPERKRLAAFELHPVK